MEEQNTEGRTRKRKSIQDRLREVLLDDEEPLDRVITKGKLKKLRHKFDEPIQESFVDGWGDDMEVDCK